MFRVFKSGELSLKTDHDKKETVKVFVKILHSESDVQAQIYTDAQQSCMYGYLTPLKCDIQMDPECNKTFVITKTGSLVSNSALQCVTFVAKSATDAAEWIEALSYLPVNRTPTHSPSYYK